MKQHLLFSWWKYLLALVLPVAVWCSVFHNLAQPAPEKTLRIYYVGDQLDARLLEQTLTQVLPEMTRQDLLSVTVDQGQLAGIHYGDLMAARAYDYDLVIVEEDSFQPSGNQHIFGVMSTELLSCFPGGDFYMEDGGQGEMLPTGFILPAGFAGCHRGQTSCYLFVGPRCVSLDARNGQGIAGNDAALQAIYFLLEMTP